MSAMSSNANPESLPIESSDGATVEARVFRGASEGPVLLVSPAMGVPATYYDPLASALAARGRDVLVTDLRGTGTSSVRPGRDSDFGYVEMVTLDYPALVAAARARFPHRRLVLVGHSLGGQLGALHLAHHPHAFDALALVASCSIDYRGWPFPDSLRILASTQAAGLVARTLGHFPGHRLGFGGKQPKQMIVDWSAQGRTGRYEPKNAPIDFEAGLAHVRVPVLAVSIAGDSLAPPGAVDRLVRKMPRASLTRLHVEPEWKVARPNDAHFKWAREPAQLTRILDDFAKTFG